MSKGCLGLALGDPDWEYTALEFYTEKPHEQQKIWKIELGCAMVPFERSSLRVERSPVQGF